MEKTLRESTIAQFEKFSERVTKVLQDQIDEMSAEQERIIAQKRDKSFSIEQEKARLDKVGSELLAMFNGISTLAYGRTYTLEEIEWLAKGRNLMLHGETIS